MANKEKCVSSIDDLTCERHPASEFKVLTEIKTGNIFTKPINSYICCECDSEKTEAREKGERWLYDETLAHDCPHCGIVYGWPILIEQPGELNDEGSQDTQFGCEKCQNPLGKLIDTGGLAD